MRLSVIIASYNYRDFLGAAISSALAVDWRDKEVIVVDDASTDNSRSVIDGFGDNVAAYFRPKSHQLGTHRFGFEQSSGDVIVFLDADDLLEIEVMREIATVWRVGVFRGPFRMTLIDADGTQLGTAFPQFPVAESPKSSAAHICAPWLIRRRPDQAMPTPEISCRMLTRWLRRLCGGRTICC